MTYDFGGWATRNDIRCSDGRTIRKDAFKHNDGQKVPLVWNHSHNDPSNVLGHALLENRDEGVYAYCTFNDTESGRNAKSCVKHGDVTALSIYANKLKQNGGDVIHGAIREVSLVLAGANPGAFIDSVLIHGELSEEDAVIYTDEFLDLSHADDMETLKPAPKKVEKEPEMEKQRTVEDVFNTFSDAEKETAYLLIGHAINGTQASDEDRKSIESLLNKASDEQKNVIYALVGQALNSAEQNAETPQEVEHSEFTEEDYEDDEEGEEEMSHNIFENNGQYVEQDDYLSHSEMEAIFADVKRCGTLKEATLQHGIEQIDYLFPDAKNVTTTPQFIQREMGWVQKVMGKTHHTPFSRIKSMFADITGEEARARGYIKGKLKKEEVFSLLKRTTTPQTIYKKQKLDRDDIIDITDFDVVAWLKSEMRVMLDEEIARAILVGDGRLSSSDDKINEQNIRPIWKDHELYTIKHQFTMNDAQDLIDNAVLAKVNYRGSGSPTCFMTEAMLAQCLLLKDTNKHRLYKNADEVATAMGVSEIVTVPVMEGLQRTNESKTYNLHAIIVNLTDYNVGADKGGSVNMFDDFDIDYNAQKYLIETRCSGALIKPYSAIVLETEAETD